LNKKLRTTYKTTTVRGTGQQTVQHRRSLMTILFKAYIAMLNQIHRSWTYV